MIFNGDLSKYHPADAIMFLSQLNLNGVLSIAEGQHLIVLSFNQGCIVDAHSRRGDAKILQALLFQHRLTSDQAQRIRRIQSETGMPIRSILAQLDFFPLAAIAEILLVGMHEALLEMFLLDAGAFHFTDTPVDPDDAATRLDAAGLSIRFAAQSDEFRDFAKSIGSLDRGMVVSADPPADRPSDAERLILRLAASCKTIGQLIEKAPFDSFTVMEVVKAQVERGIVELLPAAPSAAACGTDGSVDPVFGAFRQALKKLMLAGEPVKQLEALVTYCRMFYDGMLILTARNGQLVHCKQIRRTKDRAFVQKSTKGQLGNLAEDACLAAVHRSGVGFFGQRLPSTIVNRLAGGPMEGECALIPVTRQGEVSIFLYVYCNTPFSGLSPQHYLELLSWTAIHRQPGTSGISDNATAREPRPTAQNSPGADQVKARKLIAQINDLPPLPTVVTRALELLSDPGAAVKEIESVIGKDQALVSKLIRVSNSALYGGMNRVESLQQALTRLGAKTTKSLIVASSMQGYFVRTNPGMQAWGQSLWQHSAECGLAARRIAAAIGYDDPEQAFVGGVVHDIGKLVILLAGNDIFQQVQNLLRRGERSEIDAERRIMGTDHVAVGIQLMEKWNMPTSAQQCVKFHHRVDAAGEVESLAAITAYANHLSHLYGAHPKPAAEDQQAAIDRLAQRLNISMDRRSAIEQSVVNDFQEAGTL